MTIQFNTDNNLTVHDTFKDTLSEVLTKELKYFKDHITRLEVHLSDENGKKEGPGDKRCVLEARMQGRAPIAVTGKGNNYELAVNDAADKLSASLKTVVGKLHNH